MEYNAPADEKKAASPQLDADVEVHRVPLDAVPKSRWERMWPVIACGAGLFSDGYLNGVRRACGCQRKSELLTGRPRLSAPSTPFLVLSTPIHIAHRLLVKTSRLSRSSALSSANWPLASRVITGPANGRCSSPQSFLSSSLL